MKTQAILLLLLSLSGLYLYHEKNTNTFLQATEDSEIQVFKAFQAWKAEYNQNFNSGEEEFRFQQFRKNYDFVNQHNASGDQLVLKMNAFGAMSTQEFSQRFLLEDGATVDTSKNHITPKSQNISVDWKAKGAVLPTTDQGNCGSCWAFSTIGSLQGLRQIVDGVLERLSAQQLVSCLPKKWLNPKFPDGCHGSNALYGFMYTQKAGIETAENYPYVSGLKGEVPSCHHDKKDSVFFNQGYGEIPYQDVAEMKKIIQQQPISVAVAGSSVFFQFYHKGILKNKFCGNQINHQIIMTGIYDVEGEEPYWTVQNSWGPEKWGQDGFGQVAITEGDGVCGINMQNFYPTAVQQQQVNQF